MTSRPNAARNLAGDWVSGNYFDLLGVQPEAGHLFHEADEHGANSAPFIVLSDALWRSEFHSINPQPALKKPHQTTSAPEYPHQTINHPANLDSNVGTLQEKDD